MSDFGVQSTGFVRKKLPDILTDIQTKAEAIFGPTIIQTAQSPLGQLNGLMADLAAQLWEIAEDVYQSYDPDQAEGVRLDTLARIRILARVPDETDLELRQAVTNEGRARFDIQDLTRAVLAIDGVTYAQLFVNDTNVTDANGVEAHSIAVATIGGDVTEIATTVRRYVTPGIGTSGPTAVDVNIDGYCRTIRLVRPDEIPVQLDLLVRRYNDNLGCPPPALGSIADALAAELDSLMNGQDVTIFVIRSAVERLFPGVVEFVSVTGKRVADGGPLGALPIAIDFDEIATFLAANINVQNAP